jgi:hypothetical protein
MRLLVLLLMLCFGLAANSQRFHIDAMAGLSNYAGELQAEKLPIKTMKPVVGVGFSYELSEQLYIRSNINYTSISGKDKPRNLERNLSFETHLFEINVLAEYDILNIYDYKIAPYVFAGAALFNFDPFAYDTSGRKHFLQPLGTEGQGLSIYPDRQEYSLWQFAVPFGLGIKYQVNDNFRISAEAGVRLLFTDYIDDVSGNNYVDDILELQKQRGPKAVELSYRGGELPNALPYPAGAKRGSDNNDWYYWGQVRFTFRLGDNTMRLWQRNVRFN